MRKLFEDALREPEDQRQAFLEAQCQGNRELVQAVARLLSAHTESADFLARRNERKRFGRYVVTREIGRGAMGIVYEAKDPLIGRHVALKVLRLDTAESSNLQFLTDCLFREAQSGGRLSNPGIVTIFDVGQEGSEAFIAMELVEGQTLQDILSASPNWDWSKVLDVLKQSAAALDYAHQRGIVHRDIKPANIMLDHNGTVKIADFGIARITATPLQTATAIALGTPTYMSPEQIQIRKVDCRSDQFSLAVVAFELLTGTRPFQADSIASLAHQIVYDDPPSASALNPRLPKAIDKPLRRGLAKEPAHRFDSCSQLVDALDLAMRGGAPKPRSRAVNYLIGSCAAATILLAGATVYRSRMQVPPPGRHLPLPATHAMEVPKTVGGAQPASAPAVNPPATTGAEPVRSGKQLYAEAVATQHAGQAKASILLEEAAELGEVDAMVALGGTLLEGEHPDLARARYWFVKAADKDDTNAMNWLGLMYQNAAFGFPEDSKRAAEWYRKAAKKGNANAMYNLGNMFASGLGVDKDLEQAKGLFRRSAAKGNSSARSRLAELEGSGR
jgi:TPR repeat protein/predicted Ser/Thr protein kinase